MKIFAILLLTGLLLFSGYVLAGDDMKEGMWEITASMEMPGMPMKMPPQTFKQCLTKKDMVPQKEEPGQKCKMIKNERKGNTVIWVMECTDKEGKSTINGRATYKGTTFTGVVKVKQDGMEMTQDISGRWIGQCR